MNVLSSRGIVSGDEVICDICSSLAGMLRYSTDNINRQARLSEEIQYLKEYFYLLKSRYDYKLNYIIEIEETLNNEVIPKITLQQIVENSIKHGYENSASNMQIEVRGWQEGDRWYISISDNGEGFSEEALGMLEDRLAHAKECLLDCNSTMILEIGGMGLINTYARLYLLYGEELSLEIVNSSQGARVTIGSKKQ